MSLEISYYPFAVTWRVDPHRPTWTQWSRMRPNAPGEKPKPRKWRDYLEYPTPRDASLAAQQLGHAQFVPKGDSA